MIVFSRSIIVQAVCEADAIQLVREAVPEGFEHRTQVPIPAVPEGFLETPPSGGEYIAAPFGLAFGAVALVAMIAGEGTVGVFAAAAAIPCGLAVLGP